MEGSLPCSLCPSLDLFPDSFPGMGPGATATGHADRARQWFAGRPAVHQKEPGEQSQDKGVGLDKWQKTLKVVKAEEENL